MDRSIQDAMLAKADKNGARASFGLAVHRMWSHWPSAIPKASPQVPRMQLEDGQSAPLSIRMY